MYCISVPVRQPFDFHLTVGHQTHYRGRAGADVYADGVYYRVLRRAGQVFAVGVQPTEGGNALEICLHNEASDNNLTFAARTMARMLALDVDLAGFYELVSEDSVMQEAVCGLHGLRPARSETLFEALVMAIVAQQISAVIARLIRDGIVSGLGNPVEANGIELYAFPSPERILEATVEELRTYKLSGRKIEYIKDCARRTVEGQLDPEWLETMDDEEAIAELTQVRGIGRWTAEWVLMRALGRLDVLPAGDLALRRVVSELYLEGRPISEKELGEFAMRRWHPYRGLATTYLFAHLRQQRVAREAARAAPNMAL